MTGRPGMVALERAFAYDRWANRALLQHLRQLPDVPDQAVRFFAHVLSAITVWLVRLKGQSSAGIPIWPAASLDDCEAMLASVEAAMDEFLRTSTDLDLSQQIHYTNQHGHSYATSMDDVLFHMATHGGYHRGQIALVLRESGLPPINTDYITYVREMAGQPWTP